MKKTVLIIGITSFVGSNLAEVLSEKYHVVGTYFKHRSSMSDKYQMLQMNVLDKEEIKRTIRFFRPDYVIYAVGISSLTEARKKPREVEALNSTGAINCLSIAERAGALFIYLSSSYVLSGDNKFFKESDTPMPQTAYGVSVANAEFLIQRTSLHYLIIRCPVLYGLSFNDKRSNILEMIQQSIFENKTLKLDDHIEMGFLDVQLIARFLTILLEKNVVNRLLQISSKDHLTSYQFAKKYAQVFNVASSSLEASNILFPVDGKNENNIHGFKMDISNTEKRIGIKMPTIQESLEFTQKRFISKSF